MYRLGAQGRAVQQQLARQDLFVSGSVPVISPEFKPSQAQNDVNMLLSILRSTSNNLQVSNLLSYVCHYFPRVKNEGNLKLLSSALFENSIIFNDVININDSYLIIEAVKALFDTKIEISEPSLPLPEFYHSIIEALFESNLAPYKKVLVITGILLSKPLYETQSIPETHSFFEKSYSSLINLNHELLVTIFQNAQINGFEINTLTSIALSCSLPFFNKNQKLNLPHDQIMLFTSDLLFKSSLGLNYGNTDQLSDSNSPVLKHLSRLSFLIENCLLNGVSYPILNSSFQDILRFSLNLNKRVVNSPKSWDFLKNILFSIIIIFQGFSSFSLNLFNGLNSNQYSQISDEIMKTLFYLNFIIEKIGTGGFQAYNFVYLTTTDGLLQQKLPKAESLGHFFINSINLTQINKNPFESSKALFALQYFESLTKNCSEYYYNSVIQPFVSVIINNPSLNLPTEFIQIQRSLIEASHSVILSTFKNQKNSLVITTTAINYLNIVLSQFPLFLSSNQLKLAIETIAGSISPPSEAYYLEKDNFRELLHTLYMAILNTNTNQLLPKDDSKDLLTVKGALIDCLISVLPYIPASKFNNWLDNTWGLIAISKSNKEFQYLQDKLWEVLSEGLDIQKSNIGIQWWYNRTELESKL